MAAFPFVTRSDDSSEVGDEDGELYDDNCEEIDSYMQEEFSFAGRRINQSDTKKLPVDDVVSTDRAYHKYYCLSLKLVSAFCENVVAHPFVVLKRQCQVHRTARRYHLLPLTLIPIIIKIQGRQGLGTLWKGIGSVFIVKGLVIVFEDVMGKISHFPNEPSRLNSAKRVCQHLLLKSAALVLVTPFYSASLVETVQSDIASEKPGVIDCLTEGLSRLVPMKHNPTSTVVPVWTLAVPTAAHGVLRYIIGSGFQRLSACYMRWSRKRRYTGIKTGAIPKQYSYNVYRQSTLTPLEDAAPPSDWGYTELRSILFGNFVADVLLYPLETVMHRLHVQGTRTIVDSLDSGSQVAPLVTRYEGTIDCFYSVVADEGAAGLFKGFGALLIQYALHAAILKLGKFLLDEIEHNYGSNNTILNVSDTKAR